MALEQTVNKDCKSSGGVIGFTNNEGTLTRWLITRHLVGEYASKVENLIFPKNKLYSYGAAERERDEKDVRKMISIIESTWINPFDSSITSNDLIHIATGKIASREIHASLTTFKEKAEINNQAFIQGRLTTHGQASFWKAVSRNPIINADNIGYKKTESKTVINPEYMFRRIISAAQFKELDFKNMLSFELAPTPASLFHEDGSMRKTAKSELAKKLESFSDLITDPPQEIIEYFIDGMVVLQEINQKSFKTFDELAQVVTNKILSIFKKHNNCRRISIIFDRYDDKNSVKVFERQRRGQHNLGTYCIIGSRTVSNYKNFLRSTANKMALIKFVSNKICEACHLVPEDKEM